MVMAVLREGAEVTPEGRSYPAPSPVPPRRRRGSRPSQKPDPDPARNPCYT